MDISLRFDLKAKPISFLLVDKCIISMSLKLHFYIRRIKETSILNLVVHQKFNLIEIEQFNCLHRYLSL